METVVFVLMILVCFNFMLKQTFRKIYSVLAFAVLCALFVGLAWPYAIEQSKSQIADWLANTSLMLDISVILSIEVVIQMGFCMLAAHVQSTGAIKKSTLWGYRALRWFPGVLIFPVLFSMLVAAIFAFPGVEFSKIAWIMAVAILLLIPVGSWLIRWALPEKDVRLELLFLCNALIAILGVIATVNGSTAVKGVSEVDFGALLGLLLLIIIGTFAGLLLYRVYMRKFIKKQTK